MIIIGTFVGILLFAAGGVGLAITGINYAVGSLDFIEGLLTYGVFTLLGLALLALIVMTPRES